MPLLCLKSVPFPWWFAKATIFKNDLCMSFHEYTGGTQTAVIIVGIHFISQLK